MQRNSKVPKERERPHARWSQKHPLGAIRISPHHPARTSVSRNMGWVGMGESGAELEEGPL